MLTLTSCRIFLTRLAGKEMRTRARSVPSTSTRSRSTTFPASRPATRTGLPTRMPWPSRKTTSMVFWAARKPGPSLARLIRASNPARAAMTTSPTVTSRTEVRALILGFPPRDDLAQPGPRSGRWRLEQRGPVNRDRVIHQHEPGHVQQQDRHHRQAGSADDGRRQVQGRSAISGRRPAGALALGEPGRAQRLEAADRRRHKTEQQALDDHPDDVAKPDHPVKHKKIHV